MSSWVSKSEWAQNSQAEAFPPILLSNNPEPPLFSLTQSFLTLKAKSAPCSIKEINPKYYIPLIFSSLLTVLLYKQVQFIHSMVLIQFPPVFVGIIILFPSMASSLSPINKLNCPHSAQWSYSTDHCLQLTTNLCHLKTFKML